MTVIADDDLEPPARPAARVEPLLTRGSAVMDLLGSFDGRFQSMHEPRSSELGMPPLDVFEAFAP
jgi:hypothetical protein